MATNICITPRGYTYSYTYMYLYESLRTYMYKTKATILSNLRLHDNELKDYGCKELLTSLSEADNVALRRLDIGSATFFLTLISIW